MPLEKERLIEALQDILEPNMGEIGMDIPKHFDILKARVSEATTDEDIIRDLIAFNNVLGFEEDGLSATGETIRLALHQSIALQLHAYLHEEASFPDLTSMVTENKYKLAAIEHELFQGLNLHPSWLIEKHLHDRNNISVLKGEQADLIHVFEKGQRPPEAGSEEDFDPTLPPPPQPPRLGGFPGGFFQKRTYTEDPDFQMIIDQKGAELIASGVGKGGSIPIMTQIAFDGLAIVKFMGTLSPELGRDSSAYQHGPGFIILDSSAPPEAYQSAYCRSTLFEIPVNHLIFLVENDGAKTELRSNLIKALSLGIITEERMRTVESRIKTYAEYCAELDLSEIFDPSRESPPTA